jgi:hypothetical protein
MNDLSPRRSGAGRLLFDGLAYVFLALVPLTGLAGVAYQTPTISGLVGGIYKGPAPVVSGAVSTSANLSLSGRLITVPASARLAANAASYAVSALRLTPYGMIGAAAAAWLASAGITSTPDGQVVTLPPADPSSMSAEEATHYLSQSSTAVYNNMGAIDLCYAHGFQYFFMTTYGTSTIDLGCMSSTGWYDILGWSYLNMPIAPAETTRVATDDDYAPLSASPLPDSVADELADTSGVPVDPVQVAPGDVALGSPYKKPDGTWAQARAKITPTSDGRVAITPYEVPVPAPEGTPVAQPDFVPDGEPVATGTETQPDPCDLNPDRVGCVSLGEPVDQPVNKTDSVMSITPEPISMPGMCPAAKQVVTPFGTIELSYDPACQFATQIRPVVLALGLFMAGMIFVGGLRNG